MHRILPVAVLTLGIIAAACGGTKAPTSATTTTAASRSSSGSTSTTAPATSAPSSPTTLQSVPSSNLWIVAANVLEELAKIPQAAAALQRYSIIEILRPGKRPTPGFNVLPAEKFASAQALVQAVQGGTLDPWIKAVVYDPESWAQTPMSEQSNPVSAAQAAFQADTAKGLLTVITPGLDLAKVLSPGRGPLWTSFLGTGLLGRLAPFANVIEIQSQSIQTDTAALQQLLAQAKTQIDAVNPSVVILGGVSTNDRGEQLTPAELLTATQVATPYVSGFWLNVPGPGASCPSCSAPNPALAVSLLQELSG